MLPGLLPPLSRKLMPQPSVLSRSLFAAVCLFVHCFAVVLVAVAVVAGAVAEPSVVVVAASIGAAVAVVVAVVIVVAVVVVVGVARFKVTMGGVLAKP